MMGSVLIEARIERSLDSGGEGSGSSLESHQFWSLDPSNAMSSTISVTLKRKVLGGVLILSCMQLLMDTLEHRLQVNQNNIYLLCVDALCQW